MVGFELVEAEAEEPGGPEVEEDEEDKEDNGAGELPLAVGVEDVDLGVRGSLRLCP